MTYSQGRGFERFDNAYDPVPGEPPICPMADYELQAPYSYFEYELDNRIYQTMIQDQQFIPEDERPFPVAKNPHCNSELWKPQSTYKEEQEMSDPNWVPKTYYNNYAKDNFRSKQLESVDQDRL